MSVVSRDKPNNEARDAFAGAMLCIAELIEEDAHHSSANFKSF